MSFSASGIGKGVDSKCGEFFKNARRSDLWPDAEAPHKSAITKARKKLKWQIFENLFNEAVQLAYEFFPDDLCYLWKNMSVFAFDGSKYNLPATDEVREYFDPNSGLNSATQRHYPQCLVSTAYDVFRQIPVARTVVNMTKANERIEAQKLIASIPSGNVLLFDRGYPSYEFILYLNQNYQGQYALRCQASQTFPAVEAFIKSKKAEDFISIKPTKKYLARVSKEERRLSQPLKLRVIRLVSPDGTVSALLTNMSDRKTFTRNELTTLYYRRWAVEDHYRNEKTFLGIEQFHSKTPNGIQQELFAILVMSVISRILMVMSSTQVEGRQIEPQFKHTALTLASEATVLVSSDPEKAVALFEEIISEIKRVKYYRPKFSRRSQPRVSKQPPNKWREAKKKKIMSA